MGKRGPTAKPAAERKSAPISLRLRPYLREALETAAQESRRPLSEEVTSRLTRSLREDKDIEAHYGNRANFRMANVLGIAVGRAHTKFEGRDWLGDPVVFDFVMEVVVSTLNASRPGEPQDFAVGRIGADGYGEAREIGRSIWRDIAEAGQGDPLNPYKNIADDLSEVVRRPNLYRSEFNSRSRKKLQSLMMEKGLSSDRDPAWTVDENMDWLRLRGELLKRADSETLEEMLTEGKDPRIDREDTF